MEKHHRIFILTLLISLFFFPESSCHGSWFGSGIYKVIQSYSGDYYDTRFTTGAVESQIYNYYGNKRIEIEIAKHITSDWYVNHIANVIMEYYSPPMYNPGPTIDAIRRAKNEDKLFIVETAYFNFRTRSVAVLREDLYYGENVLFNLTPEATFHLDYSYCDMDSSVEYGQLANDMVDFLESIKDIYFDENKRKEYELKRLHEKNFDYYWKYLSEEWEPGADVSDVNKKFCTLYTNIYVDTKSIRNVYNFVEGWIKFDFDLDKLRVVLEEKGKTIEEIGGIDLFPNTALYYARFDFKNKQFSIIASYEVLQDNSIKKRVLNSPEIWTYDEAPDVVTSVLNKVSNIKIGKNERK